VQLDAVIGLCYTDIKKLLERIQEQGALGSKAEGAVPVKLLPNMNHFHPISIVRHRKRKRFNGARRKKSRKRRLVIKKQRQRLHMRNKMAMHKATGKNNTFCFHVDWSKLTTATALDPRIVGAALRQSVFYFSCLSLQTKILSIIYPRAAMTLYSTNMLI
jgi:hypothetical protein